MAADHKTNIKFVQEVEKYPVLYNHTLPEYVRKDLTEQAWADIGKKFKLPGGECKEKWKNLRSVFARHLKRSKDPFPKKAYYLSEFMKFTIPYIKAKENYQGAPSYEHLTQRAQRMLLDDESGSQNLYQAEDIPAESPSSVHHDFMPVSNQNCPNKSNKEHECKETKAKQLLTEYFKMKQSKNVDKYNSDECSNKMFLLSVLPDMNRMSSKKRRTFKRRLLDLVDEMVDEDCD